MKRCRNCAMCAAILFIAGAQHPSTVVSSGAVPLQGTAGSGFARGQTLRYRVYTDWVTQGERGGLVEDPQAPRQVETTFRALIRFEVLEVTQAEVRFRAHFESATAILRSDSFDPLAATLEENYRKLDGQGFEFVLENGGKVKQLIGLPQVLTHERTAGALRDWLDLLFSRSNLPAGAAPGQKWTSEEVQPASPLAGVVWRARSTYVRKGPCREPAPPTGGMVTPDPPAEECAVIETRTEILRPPGAAADPTPEDYRVRGLRTSGKWSGTGETLSYISLRTGLLVSRTQTMKESLEFTVTGGDGQRQLKYSSRAATETHITFIPENVQPE